MFLVGSVYILLVTCDAGCVRKVTPGRHTTGTPVTERSTKNFTLSLFPTNVTPSPPTPSPSPLEQTPTPSTSTLEQTPPTPSPNVQTLQTPTPSPNMQTLQTPTPSPDVQTLQTPTPSPNMQTLQTPTPSPDVKTGPNPTPIERYRVQPTWRKKIKPSRIDHAVLKAMSVLPSALNGNSIQRSIRSTNESKKGLENEEDGLCLDYNSATKWNTKPVIVMICLLSAIALFD